MQKMGITSCFISAPFGFDLSLFKKIMREHHIVTFDQSLLNLGDSVPESINMAIQKSDLFCAIIPNEKNISNIFFEIGLAFAQHKPILLFVGKSVELPVELNSLLYFPSNFENEESLQFYITSFLNFGNSELKKNYSLSTNKIPLNYPSFKNENREAYFQFEKKVEKIFKDAGYLTESQDRIRDSQIDLVLWVDKLENQFGNPILVEVKYGNLTPTLMSKTESNLRNQITKIGGNLGLIIYYDKNKREVSNFSKDLPLIIKFSIDELIDLLKKGQFESEIIAIRNRIVHGIL